MLIKKGHISVHLWELNTHPEQIYSSWTNGLVEVQNRNCGTHLRMFLHDTPKDWVFQVHMYAHAHNSQPLSEINISPHEIVFHTRPRIPLTFELNLIRNTSKRCISKHCSQLPEHSHYDKTDLYPFFYRTLSKPIPQWFVAVETALLQIFSTVYENTFKKSTQQPIVLKDTTKANHSLLALLFLDATLHTFISLTNSNPFGLVLMKSSADYLTLRTSFSHKTDLQYMFIETI